MGRVVNIRTRSRRAEAQRIIARVADLLTGKADRKTQLKQQIIDEYSDGRIDQETAMRLIREMGLRHA